MKSAEDRLQAACIRWWDMQFPKHKKLLFAVANGGHRNKITGAILKATGVRSGVADLILFWRGKAYCFELKTKTGTQQATQKEWAQLVRDQGVPYLLIRDFDTFRQIASGIVEAARLEVTS